MRWSWRIGRLAGIDLYVHWTFMLLVVWFLLLPLLEARGREQVTDVVATFLFVLAIFACVVLHELGHALTARRYGIRTRDITLLPIGGLARLERMPDDPTQELWVALAGPAVNVVIAGLLFVTLAVAGRIGSSDLDFIHVRMVNFLNNLMVANVVLVLFNLIPAFPMDGGRVLRALLARKMDYLKATQLAASIGQALAIAIGIAGMFIPNPFLFFIAIFVYFGAGAESSMVETRRTLQGVPVQYAMMTRFQTLSPSDPLARAAQELTAGAQHDFPVTDGNRVVGMLVRDDLFKALQAQSDMTLVADVMRRDCPVVSQNEMLEAVFRRMQEQSCSSLPVVNGERLVGLITLENIGELMILRKASQHTQQAPTATSS